MLKAGTGSFILQGHDLVRFVEFQEGANSFSVTASANSVRLLSVGVTTMQLGAAQNSMTVAASQNALEVEDA